MKNNARTLLFLILLLLLGGGLGYWWLQGKKSISKKDWEGEWKVSYFYGNEPELLYTGNLKIALKDTIEASLEVFAPKSRRSEKLELSSLNFGAGGIKLGGQARHIGYKIKEGNLTEAFELELTDAGHFIGSGKCAAFCAEGTEGIGIIWTGTKLNMTSTKNQ